MDISPKSLTATTLFRVFVISLTFTIITHPGLWMAVASGYSEDYLFNLSTRQIIGLVLITSGFVVLLFLACTVSSHFLCRWGNQVLPRWLMVLMCTVFALLLCAIALALVPQLYYLYYRWIIPGLPAQWVPVGDLSLTRLWQYFLLSADGTTTDHAKGSTVWLCTCASAVVAFEFRLDPT